MEKVASEELSSFYYQYPSVATIVTSHSEGRDNAMAVAWHGTLSRRPPMYMVAISPKRFSHGLIVQSGEFTVNFLPFSSAKLVVQIGGCSGRDVDKFHEFGLTKVPTLKVTAPVLDAAYAAYECRVAARYPSGDHDCFFGEIVAVHHYPLAYGPRKTLDLEQEQPLLYLGDGHYTTASREGIAHLE